MENRFGGQGLYIFDEPAAAEDSRDLFSLGRTLERRGEEEARALYARSRDVPEGSYRLFVLLRRAGEWDEARALLEDMVRNWKGSPQELCDRVVAEAEAKRIDGHDDDITAAAICVTAP